MVNFEEPQRKLAYSIAEIAEMTSLSRAQVYEEIRARRLKAVKMGRRTLVTAEEACRWMRALAPFQTTKAEGGPDPRSKK